ncbi:MAG: dITP/XTP pyrophosphatase RdgB [Rhodobacteraceae bacterium HLUCCA12]|nr:MAG: dITP/XTP pyrophosphatase RdgB [Rhodobacteraceae bacterium HLUCCA12]
MRRFDGETLLIATHNAGKLDEMRAMLAQTGVSVVSSSTLGLAEPDETEDSFLGNARIKAHYAAKASGLIALGDDSGLEVDALDGAPGVYTADWAETPGGRDFSLAMLRVHDALLAANAPKPWHARFRCTLVLAWPDGHEQVFEGAVEGALTWPVRGKDGHGFDPMFVPEGDSRTFAEMSADEKNRVSHRFRAIRALRTKCFT